jgi:ABC-type sugar transport system substrate-binding protein
MRAGEWDNSISYNVSQDILTTFPEGTIDVVVGNCDESCLAFMEAAKAAGRTDIGAGYVGADSPVAMLEKITNGEAFATAENSPYYGYVTFEYAIRWLNGEDIPQRIMLPNRFWRAETDEQMTAMKGVVTKAQEDGVEFVPASYGYYDVFDAMPEAVKKYYSVPLWQDRDKYKDIPYYETTESTIR